MKLWGLPLKTWARARRCGLRIQARSRLLGGRGQGMSEPLWGGRFSKGPSEALAELSRSIQYDQRLWPHDIACTRAHAANLERAGLISADDQAAIGAALGRAAAAFAVGLVRLQPRR